MTAHPAALTTTGTVVFRSKRFGQLSADELYGLLRLRSEVFIIGQECLYQDLDGRDREPDTTHLWAESGGRIVSCLRVLLNPDGHGSIGRVATAADARGQGHAAELVRRALELLEGRTVDIGAQEYLKEWYGGFGFEQNGDPYLEQHIPHIPMTRVPGTQSR